MAILKYSALIDGIRGSLGGTVFSANATSTYIRPSYRPSNPRTHNQSVARSHLAQLSADWRALSAPQRAGWRVYAAAGTQEKFNSLGQSYFASGFNWFCQINRQQFTIDGTPQSSAPGPTAPVPPTPGILTAVSNPILDILSMTITNAEFVARWLVVFIAVTQSEARFSSPARPLFTFEAGPSTMTPVDLLPSYTALFGPLISDSKIFVSFAVQRSTGPRSPYTIVSAVVT